MGRASAKIQAPDPVLSDAVHSALYALANDTTLASRISGKGTATFLDLLLPEIDRIVLPRRLVVSSDGRSVGTLLVLDRKLIDVALASDPATQGAKSISSAPPDADELAGQVLALAADLDGAQFQIRRDPCADAIDQAGCCVRDLEEALRKRRATSKLSAFLTRIQPHLLAWVKYTEPSEQTDRLGEADQLTHLDAVAKIAVGSHRTTSCPTRLSSVPPSLTVLTSDADACVLICADGKETAVLSLRTAAIDIVIESWSDIFRES